MSPPLTAPSQLTHALLGAAIDYAGLFPPASLPLPEAVANYQAYRASSERWALGRFVIPAARLAELAAIDGAATLPLSVLLGTSIHQDLAEIDRAGLRVEAVEVRAGAPEQAGGLLDGIPGSLARYVEVPAGDVVRFAAVLVSRGAHAKVRTGGTTADAFPEPAVLADFLRVAAARRLAFKATAGLHHPLRGLQRLTYESTASRATMYGYLNLILASLVAQSGGAPVEVQAALVESDPGAIRLGADALRWRAGRWTGPDVTRMRTTLCHGFGSCSFREPMEEWPL